MTRAAPRRAASKRPDVTVVYDERAHVFRITPRSLYEQVFGWTPAMRRQAWGLVGVAALVAPFALAAEGLARLVPRRWW